MRSASAPQYTTRKSSAVAVSATSSRPCPAFARSIASNSVAMTAAKAKRRPSGASLFVNGLQIDSASESAALLVSTSAALRELLAAETVHRKCCIEYLGEIGKL